MASLAAASHAIAMARTILDFMASPFCGPPTPTLAESQGGMRERLRRRRELEQRPEDHPEGNVSDGARVVGRERIHYRTVENHRNNIARKLGLNGHNAAWGRAVTPGSRRREREHRTEGRSVCVGRDGA